MEASDDSVPVRKAFSAENAKEDCSSSKLPYVSNNKFLKTCASASYLSSRKKYMPESHVQNLLSDDFLPKSFHPDAKEDQKLVLRASQILEKLNKIINKFSATSHHSEFAEIATHPRKTTFREIVLYQDVLKRLLEERCVLILKEDCDLCINRTLKLISDFKLLYASEKLKMTTMPTQACNRFVSCDDISVSTLELLIKKLQIICDLHLSISSSFQKIINCFNVSLDLELYQMILKSNRLLNKKKSVLFHWAYQCMTVLMQKLCLADPNSVSPDFLCSILASCEIFNTVLKNNKLRDCYQKPHDLFYKDVKNTECKKVPFSLILSYLAYFEAKTASDRIVHFGTLACKKNLQTNLNKKKTLCNEKQLKYDCGTSDYHSVSISDMDSEKSTTKNTEYANTFANLLVSIIQRNQSLILKYIYAFTNLSNMIKRRTSYESNACIITARQMWNVPEQNFRNDSYILLEESFWLNFWNNVQMFILKILYEVPYHQYGDVVAGTVLLWPDTYVDTFLECLKSSLVNVDITDEGKYTIKQIYEYIFIHKMHTLWDKEFSLALTSTLSHCCILVPTSLNQVQTLPSNLFQICIDVLLGVFKIDFQNMDLLIFLQCLQQLLCTLDSFILWISTRTRAVFASQNLSTYLIISWSDCKNAIMLLQTKTTVLAENTDSFTRIPASQFQKEKIFWKQIDVLKGYVAGAPHLVYKFCFRLIRDELLRLVKKHFGNKCFGKKTVRLDAVEELLYSFTPVVKLSNPLPILTAVSRAFVQAFLFILHHLKKAMSAKSVQFFIYEFSKFDHWLDDLDLVQEEKRKLNHLDCLKKVQVILNYMQALASRSNTFSMSLNRIMPGDVTGPSITDDVLSEQEKRYWQSKVSRNLLSCL